MGHMKGGDSITKRDLRELSSSEVEAIKRWRERWMAKHGLEVALQVGASSGRKPKSIPPPTNLSVS